MFSALSVSTFSDSGSSKTKETKIKLLDSIFRCADDAHICIDTTAGNGEYAIDIHVRENEKSDQTTQSEDAGEKASLDGATNESVQNCLRLAETSLRTGNDDHQRN